jgi:Rad3-related DNA helicase
VKRLLKPRTFNTLENETKFCAICKLLRKDDRIFLDIFNDQNQFVFKRIIISTLMFRKRANLPKFCPKMEIGDQGRLA